MRDLPGATERTMLVTIPDFDERSQVVRPFRFSGLERVSRAQMRLIDRLDWLMPGVDASGRVGKSLLARLEELFESDVQILQDYLHVIRPKELPRYLSDPTVLAALIPAPQKPRGFLEIELAFAHAAIDMLLGGANESMALRPLSEIEEGVITFLAMEALAALAPDVLPGLPRIRLDTLVHGVDEVGVQLAGEAHVAVVQLKMVLGRSSGFLRLFIPQSVLGLTNPPVGSPERRARIAAKAEKHLTRLRGVKSWLRAEIGQALITAGDLAGLGEGDVVLTDELTCRPDVGEAGTGRLRVGLGRVGHLDAEMFVEGGKYRAKITGIQYGGARETREPSAREEEAAEALAEGVSRLDEPEADSTSPEHRRGGMEGLDVSDSNEGAELLEDIPLQVAVELARLPVTAEQVVSLRVGQILDLDRVPGEPVELSVNSKVVARGELVDVEGHMGVRIVSLAG